MVFSLLGIVPRSERGLVRYIPPTSDLFLFTLQESFLVRSAKLRLRLVRRSPNYSYFIIVIAGSMPEVICLL